MNLRWFIIGTIAAFAFLWWDQQSVNAWLASQNQGGLPIGAPGTPTASIMSAGGPNNGSQASSASAGCGCGGTPQGPVSLLGNAASASPLRSGFGFSAGPSTPPYNDPNAGEFYWQTLEND